MIEHCLQVYLKARHDEARVTLAQDKPRPTSTMTFESREQFNGLHPRPSLDTRSLSDPRLSPQNLAPDGTRLLDPNGRGSFDSGKLSGDHLQLTHRKNLSAERSDLSDHDGALKSRVPCDSIFRLVENYVTSCLASCATLNRSFVSVRPELQRAASEGQSVRTAPSKSHLFPPGNDSTLMEMEVDAKTLLLGDIAENGSWWTGERLSRGHSTHTHGRERSLDPWQGVVSLKSPRINWKETASWYRCLLNAGDPWREKWSALQGDPTSKSSHTEAGMIGESGLSARIENDLLNSRNHLQRVLLKATENLLKRPKRPLKHPEDCRFLFIILANPLLVPSDSSWRARRSHTPNSSRRPGPGQHSGIIKRVLGLLAHLPNEIHQYLVSWFSRFSENQFQQLVDLVGGFVTYRLSRASHKREAINPTDGLVPSFSDSGAHHASQLHAAIGGSRSTSSKPADSSGKPQLANYSEDWQVRAAARVMSLLFAANGAQKKKREVLPSETKSHSVGLTARYSAHVHGQLIPISSFYNTMLDYADLNADFEIWESKRGKFSFCQYPFFLSIYAKIHLMEMEARRQMEIKAREAFFDSILSNKAVSQFLVLKVRRDCLVEDS